MEKNATMDAHGGPVARRTRLRNDTRSLLRSRPVQALLAGVAALQVVAAAGSGHAPDGPRHFRDLLGAMLPAGDTSAPVPMPAAVAAPPLKTLQKLASTSAKTPEGQAKVGKTVAEAQALADQYRERGYDVSPTLAEQIHQAAMKSGIDPVVAFGLVRTESGFKNTATSHVGAIGLTQLMPGTARWFRHGITRSDLRDPEVNLNIGFRYLRELIDKYDGNTKLALTAYNRGPGTVDRVLKRGGDPDNGYAAMVMGRKKSRR